MPLMDRFSDISKVNVCGAARDLLAGTRAGAKGRTMLKRGRAFLGLNAGGAVLLRRVQDKNGGGDDDDDTPKARRARARKAKVCERGRANGAESSAYVH
jgi:hypothetical protein